MSARRIGFWVGIAGFLATVLLPAPLGMPEPAWPAPPLSLRMWSGQLGRGTLRLANYWRVLPWIVSSLAA